MVPKVSIVIPVYNVEKYLDRCVNSVLNQTLKEIEIILVDDGSPDRCPEMCDRYSEQDSRIKVIHKINGGLGMARNSGMQIANGEFVAFVDSDDFVQKDMYEKFYESAKGNNLDVCVGGFYRVSRDGGINSCYPALKNQLFIGKEIYTNVFLNLLGSRVDYYDDIFLNASSCFCIYSVKMLKKNNISFYSEREYISEDLIFNLEAFKYAGKVYFLNECFYTYCENLQSLTQKYRQDRYSKFKILDEKLKSLVPYDDSYNEAIRRIQRSFLGRARQCIYAEVQHFPFKKACENIKKICNQEYLIETLHEFEIGKLPKKLFVFSYFMKKKASWALYVIVKLKNNHCLFTMKKLFCIVRKDCKQMNKLVINNLKKCVHI